MVRRGLLALALVAGCDRWQDPEPTWTLDSYRIGFPELFGSVRARPSVDGETIAIVSEHHLGDRDLAGANVVRIDRSGAIAAVHALPELGSVGTVDLGVDARGRPVGVWSPNQTTFSLIGFDENLEPRWTAATSGVSGYACCTLERGGFDVCPGGEVAFVTGDSGGRFTLHYLGDDGAERWAIDAGFTYRFVIVEGGDVLVFGGSYRRRLAAADGAIVEDIAHGGANAVARDGSAVAVVDAGITYYEPNGDVRWQRRETAVPGSCPPGGCGPSIEHSELVVLAGDSVLVQLHTAEEIRLRATTGDRAGSTEHCHEVGIEGGDATGYLTLGASCAGTLSLAKYALPE